MSLSPREDLVQVLYVSQSVPAPVTQIRRLHEASIRNNRAQGVTGLLLYTGGHFAQWLEGAPAVLQALLARIATDPRHTRMRTLSSKVVEQRSCAEWSMKLMVDHQADEQVRRVLDASDPSIQQVTALLARMKTLATRPGPG